MLALEQLGDLLERYRSAAAARVREFEIGYDLATGVHHHDRVVTASPIESSIVGDFFPFFHRGCFFSMHRGAVVRQPDTRSLAGCCSLRRWDGRRQTDR